MLKGDEGDCLYILYEGEVNIYVNDLSHVTVTLGERQVFGERALVTDEVRGATVAAKTPHVVCLSLSKKDYKDILYVSLLPWSSSCLACEVPAEVQAASLSFDFAVL
jgi:CRP-like cAMP-binding protein